MHLRNPPENRRVNQPAIRNMPSLSDSLSEFVTCVQAHLSGDEKGEAADFLDHLFRAFGHDGIREAGATRETRLAFRSWRRNTPPSSQRIAFGWHSRSLRELRTMARQTS